MGEVLVLHQLWTQPAPSSTFKSLKAICFTERATSCITEHTEAPHFIKGKQSSRRLQTASLQHIG